MIYSANMRLDNSLLAAFNEIPAGDKLGHFLLMGSLSLIVNLLLQMKTISFAGQRILWGSLLVAVIVSTEEFSQMYIPSRTFSLLDLVADYAGILLFGRLAYWFSGPKFARLAKFGTVGLQQLQRRWRPNPATK